MWGSAGKIETDKILVLQKHTITLISNKDKRLVMPGPLASTNPMFFKLEILKVNDIFTLQIYKFIYRCLMLDNFHEWFKLSCVSHPYNTRSNFIDISNIVKSNNIFILGARTSFYGLRLIKVEGPKLWNALPKYICNNNSLISFVKCLKNYLIQKYSLLIMCIPFQLSPLLNKLFIYIFDTLFLPYPSPKIIMYIYFYYYYFYVTDASMQVLADN